MQPLLIGAALLAAVAASEWLAERTALRHLGSALLVIVLTALLANIGIIPTYSGDVAIYTGIFEYVAPLSIFLLLLQVRLAGLLRAGLPMLLLFLLGAAGTTVGVFAGMAAVGGEAAFGEAYRALGGMFVGTYIGGSVNFNAIALEYGVMQNGALYAGAAAVDSAMTTLWMAVTVLLPRLLGNRGTPTERRLQLNDLEASKSPNDPAHPPRIGDLHAERAAPFDIAALLGLGAASVAFSAWLAERLAANFGMTVPSVLILTTLALLAAQLPQVQRIAGARTLGWFSVMLFLAVIGALCDIGALRRIGALAADLSLFVVIVIAIHGVVVFGIARLLRLDPAQAAVASQANVGGGTSALALARSLGREELVVPAILIGAVGNGLGTYLGFLATAWL